MKRLYLLYLLLSGCFAGQVLGQVGEKVSPVNVMNMNNQSVSLPMLGQKNLLIFYADPSHPRQNKDFREYLKTHPINNPEIDSYGVINMAAAPMIPDGIIRKMAIKELKGTNGQVYFDPDEVLGNTWKLPGADNNFAIIFVGKDQVIKFYKAGQLTPEEQQQLLNLIEKSER